MSIENFENNKGVPVDIDGNIYNPPQSLVDEYQEKKQELTLLMREVQGLTASQEIARENRHIKNKKKPLSYFNPKSFAVEGRIASASTERANELQEVYAQLKEIIEKIKNHP